MTLTAYRMRRDFSKTSEPEPKGEPSEGNTYVIQKHQASHLHYDLRLERNGVLKSWAIPKEPPLSPGIRRLAMQTEDHPKEYAYFEGEIPKGEYGAGTVEIWDKGNYVTEKWQENEIIIIINGQKLKGAYCFIAFKGNWLFFKRKMGGDVPSHGEPGPKPRQDP